MVTVTKHTEYGEVRLDLIRPNPDQPRREFDLDELNGLAESIRQNGVLQPVIVTRREDHYELVDGERRVRAARLAGLAEIPAIVRSDAGENDERLIHAIVANLQRADLNPVEEGQSFVELRKRGWTLNKIALMAGKSTTWVSQRILLAEMDVEIRHLFAMGSLPLNQQVIYAIRDLPDEVRVRTARQLAARNATGAVIVNTCNRIGRDPQPRRRETRKWNRAVLEDNDTPGGWNAIEQVRLAGKMVEAEFMTGAAMKVCQKCALFEQASRHVCGECPMVELLIEIGK